MTSWSNVRYLRTRECSSLKGNQNMNSVTLSFAVIFAVNVICEGACTTTTNVGSEYYSPVYYSYNGEKLMCDARIKGDGFCDDINNHVGCAFDGGDCCWVSVRGPVETCRCTKCTCLDPQGLPETVLGEKDTCPAGSKAFTSSAKCSQAYGRSIRTFKTKPDRMSVAGVGCYFNKRKNQVFFFEGGENSPTTTSSRPEKTDGPAFFVRALSTPDIYSICIRGIFFFFAFAWLVMMCVRVRVRVRGDGWMRATIDSLLTFIST